MRRATRDGAGLLHVLRSQRQVLQTLWMGVVLVMVLRACRQLAIPLWGNHIGIAPATVALIYGISSAVDVLAFYPAGSVMDRCGRLWIALPSSLMMGLALDTAWEYAGRKHPGQTTP